LAHSSAEIVDINNKMEEYLATKKYIPTREFYREPKKGTTGFFTEKDKGDQPEGSKALEAMINDVNEMEDLIKNNFLQSEVRKQEFFKNNPVQNTLREQVQKLQKEVNELQNFKNQQL
jgi:nitrogen regulatory protein PII-like uncharacterized protein